MKWLKNIPSWGLVTGVLLAAALVFRFALRGYSYIAHTLTHRGDTCLHRTCLFHHC